MVIDPRLIEEPRLSRILHRVQDNRWEVSDGDALTLHIDAQQDEITRLRSAATAYRLQQQNTSYDDNVKNVETIRLMHELDDVLGLPSVIARAALDTEVTP